MPGIPFPGRPGGEHDEPQLDMIIARRALPPDAPPEMHDLARMLAALAGPAESWELASEAAVRAAFRRAAFRRAASPAGVSSAARRPVRHRRSRAPSRSRARLAMLLVAAVAGLGSVLAAYADVLPSPIQQLAHVTVAAPTPHHAGSLPSTTTWRARHAAHVTRRPPVPGPARRSARGPGHGPAAARRPGRWQFPKPHFSPAFSPPPGQGPAWPSCNPARRYSADPSPTATAYPNPAPTWPQAYYCTGNPAWPTSQPTPNPHGP